MKTFRRQSFGDPGTVEIGDLPNDEVALLITYADEKLLVITDEQNIYAIDDDGTAKLMTLVEC